MDVDAALSEVPVNILALLDDTDFKTRETGVTFDQAGMDLVWNFVTTAGAFTQTAVVPTSAGNYDWTNQGDGIYTIEIPASGGASINNDTEGFGWFTGFATGILPWRGPIIGFRAAALNNSLMDGATIDVNVTAMAANVITATAIAQDAITADKIANAAIEAGAFAAGAIDATAIAANAITSAKIATDAIGAAQIAAGAITSSEAPNLDAAISTRATPAQVNTEVLDVLTVDTFAQPGQEAPAATTTFGLMLRYVYKFLRNRITQTATLLSIFNDDAVTVDHKSTVSDNSVTYDRGEIGSGP